MLFDDDFLLESDVARDLYHRYAAGQPIIDYHCHLPPEHIAGDHRFRSLTEAWLEGDHYKWRAMRSNGVPEDYCTGDKSDWEKLEAWAATVPKTLRNPLYHWTHLELKFPFGIRRLLGPTTAREIFERGRQILQLTFEHLAVLGDRREERVQLGDGVGRRFIQIEQLANFRQREAKPLAAQRQFQACAVAARINATQAARALAARREQPLVLVEADGAGRDVEFAREFGDRELLAHGRRVG